ncbi:MAG: His/Gly/Thr/Pro-type tRNA ligase C-terminal domain-containing protein, partial [Dehalococcoidia bacterium]
LIEHYGGAFPVWLAPVQAVVIPITDRHLDYARGVADRLGSAGIRVEVDDRKERMNLKIREAQLQKVPYMLVVGDKEVAGDAAAVRLRSGEDRGALGIPAVIEMVCRDIEAKA